MSESPARVGSQTLSRGIQILEVLATAGWPQGIDDIAAHLGVHRSVAYRLIRTLEAHGLVRRTGTGHLSLGPGLAALAAGVEVDLRATAVPALRGAAEDLGLTCFLVLRDGDECMTVASVEPSRAVAVVAQRPGTRHALVRGATGRAILSQLGDAECESVIRAAGTGASGAETVAPEVRVQLLDEVRGVVSRGWAETADEVIPGLRALAVPLSLPDGRAAAVATISVGAVDLSADPQPADHGPVRSPAVHVPEPAGVQSTGGDGAARRADRLRQAAEEIKRSLGSV